MAYSPSPRPTFDKPTHIPYEKVTRYLWGDKEAGQVADWIYVSSSQIHQLLFGLMPMSSFRHSDSFRTIFAADELLYVLSGVMVICNPETGEVHPVNPGEAAFFRRDTWHHVFNRSLDPLRVLEYFSPPPSTGTSGKYAQTKANLTSPRYTQDQWMKSWPLAEADARAQHSIRVVTEANTMWRLEGKSQRTLTGVLVATEHLTVTKIKLLPREYTDVQEHGGDESLYVLNGTLNLLSHETDGQNWFELSPKDGFYLPQGSPHQYYNMSAEPVEFICGVAPDYFPDA